MMSDAIKVKITTEIVTNKTKLSDLIRNGIDGMIPAVSEQAHEDCNYFARKYQGTMILSSETASDFKKGELVWNTPYAKKVYYTGTPSQDANPNASLMWCEKAYDTFGGKWQKIAQKAFAEGMG